jgi:hypothetical protein
MSSFLWRLVLTVFQIPAKSVGNLPGTGRESNGTVSYDMVRHSVAARFSFLLLDVLDVLEHLLVHHPRSVVLLLRFPTETSIAGNGKPDGPLKIS